MSETPAISTWLEYLARQHGGKPAFWADEGTLSFADLEARVRRAATGLASLGVGPGDRVALWLPNVVAWPILAFACARLGAVAVSVNTRFRSVEVADILARSGAKVLALWPTFRGIPFLDILAEVPKDAMRSVRTVLVYGNDVPASVAGKAAFAYDRMATAEAHEGPPVDAETGCMMFTTSGTTKAPKFVLHPQRSIVRHAADVARGFGYDGSDVRLALLNPFCGVFGFTQTVAGLAAGAPTYLPVAFDAERVARALREMRITHTNASDAAFAQLLDLVKDDIAFPDLRFAGFAAFNYPPEDFVRRADARGLRLVGLYGMSEVHALFSRQDENADARIRALGGGKPVSAEAAIRCRDRESGRLLPPGETGEIEIKAPSLMLEYWNDAEATKSALTEDGFLRTGDAGWTTPDGGFVYAARMGDALRLGGFLVSPTEIAAHVERHPSVERCQVVGAIGDQGMRPVAFVILKSGRPLDAGALAAHCVAGLAKYKCPARFVAVDEFPVTVGPNGTKIQLAKLRQMAEAFPET